MLSADMIKDILKLIYNQYDNIRIGIAGSYANNIETEDSDLDIVIDGDSTRFSI